MEILGLIFIPIGIVSTAYWLTRAAWYVKEAIMARLGGKER